MDIPVRFLPTQTIAPETHLVRQLVGEGTGPDLLMLNTLVITGAEPVVVDTGMAITRDGWLDQTFGLVDPDDVRWIYLSHDDGDHTGNLHQVLDRCPNATLVSNWFMVERMSLDGDVPVERVRIVDAGQSFAAGDRTFTAVVPPTFDSPTTRGLFDSSTGVYWAADSFASFVSHAVDDVRELDAGYWRESFLATQRLVSPWHQWLDPVKYAGLLDGVRSLNPSVAVGAHGPALRPEQLGAAFELLEELPHLPAVDPIMSQADLEAMLAAMAEAA